MSTATQTLQPARPAVATACLGAVVVASILEVTANNGWPLPLPSAWSLLTVLIGARFGGVAGGMWSGAVMLAYATHTSGFTTGHTSASMLWGQGSERIVAFGLAALVLVALVQNQQLLRVAGLGARLIHPSRRYGWGMSGHEKFADASTTADLERVIAVLCAVSRRSANELNDHLAVILRHCELQREDSMGADSHASHAAIAAAAERCCAATATLLAYAADGGNHERRFCGGYWKFLR
jgi:hypothetical protein